MAGGAGSGHHETVMRDEVVELLARVRSGVIVDGTLGMGGHSEALLDATPEAVRLFGLDRDPGAVESSRARLARFGARVRLFHRGYEELPDVLAGEGVDGVAGVVLDLGLSGVQLASDRGFSFSVDAPLDMRFDPTSGPTAADLIRRMPERELADALRTYGELPGSARLARRLKDAARHNRMNTTAEFAAACVEVLGQRVRKMPGPTLPAQALRILVNRELDRLDAFLGALPAVLASGGRAVVISFHSLEDRRVKRSFRDLARGGGFAALTRKPDRPGEDEVDRNRRARSARLRAVERVEGSGTGTGMEGAGTGTDTGAGMSGAER